MVTPQTGHSTRRRMLSRTRDRRRRLVGMGAQQMLCELQQKILHLSVGMDLEIDVG